MMFDDRSSLEDGDDIKVYINPRRTLKPLGDANNLLLL